MAIMTAEEMFKALGYEKKEESEGVLLYISDFENSILFEKKRVTITDLYCYGRITININHLLENAIHKQCEELGWLEKEKKQENQVTNFEHYFEYLATRKIGDIALIDGRVKQCLDIHCRECDFNGDCIENKFKWLKQPYKKPVYKLTKFEKELLQCYPDIYSFKVFNSLNGMKEKGYFKGIDDNEIIGDILAKCEVIEDRKELIKND